IAGGDSSVRFVDTNTWKVDQILKGHEKRVWNVAFSPDGSHFVTASGDGTVKVWDKDQGAGQKRIFRQSGPRTTHALLRDENTLLALNEHSVCAWNLTTGKQLFQNMLP